MTVLCSFRCGKCFGDKRHDSEIINGYALAQLPMDQNGTLRSSPINEIFIKPNKRLCAHNNN